MKSVHTLLEFIAAGFAFAAAWFWFRSGQSFTPEITADTLAALRPWLENVAHQNHLAAICTGISVAAQGLSVVVIRVGLF
ncbi:MAG TPA: hypothetical protein VMV19_14020 [Xanthobacteraceae bacterium]|nr:hypothetical protein [Xanthobacteraceae bacterium]